MPSVTDVWVDDLRSRLIAAGVAEADVYKLSYHDLMKLATETEADEYSPTEQRLVTVTDDGYSSGVEGDTQNRFVIDANGKMHWGPGDGAADVTFERPSVGALKLTGNAEVTGTTRLTGAVSAGSLVENSGAVGITPLTDSTPALVIRGLTGQTNNLQEWRGPSTLIASVTSSGLLRVASGNNGFPGLSFTGDENTGIYRVGADDLGIAAGSSVKIRATTSGLGFHGSTPIAKPAITGSKTLATPTVLGNLLTALANYGLITDSTT